MSGNHGYVRYTHGCRCDTCRAGKREYMSRRRKAAFAAPRPTVPNALHGARHTYEERGCRCELCTEAKRVYDRVQQYNRYWALKAQERAS